MENQLVQIGNLPQAVMIEQSSMRGSRSVPPAPSVVVNPSPVTGVGPVAQGVVNAGGQRELPKSITYICTNATTSAIKFIIFDAAQLAFSANPGSVKALLSTGIPTSAIDLAILQTPVLINGFNYRITTGTSGQFAQPFLKFVGDIDGSQNYTPLNMSSYQRNNAFNDLILTAEDQIRVDAYTAFVLTVAPSTTVALDFFINAMYNRLT